MVAALQHNKKRNKRNEVEDLSRFDITENEINEIVRISGLKTPEQQVSLIRGIKLAFLVYFKLDAFGKYTTGEVRQYLVNHLERLDATINSLTNHFHNLIKHQKFEVPANVTFDDSISIGDVSYAQLCIVAHMNGLSEPLCSTACNYARLFQIQNNMADQLIEYRELILGAIQVVNEMPVGRHSNKSIVELVRHLAKNYEEATGSRPGVSPDNNFANLVEWCLKKVGQKDGNAYNYIRRALPAAQRSRKTKRTVYRKQVR